MTTFYDVIKRVAKQVADARSSAATGGNTTTLVDTAIDDPDEYYNGGTIFIDQTTPVIRKITSWDLPTFTFTIPTVPTVAAATKYTVITERMPLDVIKNSINQALIEDIGQIMGWDESLTAATDTERYALPDGVYDVRRVEIGAEDEAWKVNYAWTEELGELRFAANKPETGETIRIHYVHTHDELIDIDDEIDSQVPIDLLVHAACMYCLQWRLQAVRDNEPGLKDKLSFHESRAMFARLRKRITIINRDPILARF